MRVRQHLHPPPEICPTFGERRHVHGGRLRHHERTCQSARIQYNAIRECRVCELSRSQLHTEKKKLKRKDIIWAVQAQGYARTHARTRVLT